MDDTLRLRALLLKTDRLMHASPYMGDSNLILRILAKHDGRVPSMTVSDANRETDELYVSGDGAKEQYARLVSGSVYFFQHLECLVHRIFNRPDLGRLYKFTLTDKTLISSPLDPRLVHDLVPIPPAVTITLDALSKLPHGHRINFSGVVVRIESPVHSRDNLHRVLALADSNLNIVMVRVPIAIWNASPFQLLSRIDILDCHLAQTHMGAQLVIDKQTKLSDRGPISDPSERSDYLRSNLFRWQSEWVLPSSDDFFDALTNLSDNDHAYLGLENATVQYNPRNHAPYYHACSKCKRGLNNTPLCPSAKEVYLYRVDVVVTAYTSSLTASQSTDAIMFNSVVLPLMENQTADSLYDEIQKERACDPLLPKYYSKMERLLNFTDVTLKLAFKKGKLYIDKILPSQTPRSPGTQVLESVESEDEISDPDSYLGSHPSDDAMPLTKKPRIQKAGTHNLNQDGQASNRGDDITSGETQGKEKVNGKRQ